MGRSPRGTDGFPFKDRPGMMPRELGLSRATAPRTAKVFSGWLVPGRQWCPRALGGRSAPPCDQPITTASPATVGKNKVSLFPSSDGICSRAISSKSRAGRLDFSCSQAEILHGLDSKRKQATRTPLCPRALSSAVSFGRTHVGNPESSGPAETRSSSWATSAQVLITGEVAVGCIVSVWVPARGLRDASLLKKRYCVAENCAGNGWRRRNTRLTSALCTKSQ